MSAQQAPEGRWLPIAALLDLDDRNGAPCLGDFDRVASARKQYCGLQVVPVAQHRPCGGCGRPATTLIGGIPLHLTCPDPPPGWVPDPEPQAAEAAQATAEAPGATGSPQPEDAQTGADAATSPASDSGPAEGADHLAAVLAADGLWLPGADAPARVDWPRDAGEAWQLADRFRIRQLWIHPGAHQPLGLPAEHSPNPQAPDEHPWAHAAGYACDPKGLAAWMHIAPDGGRRRAVVLPGYETRAAWADAPTGEALLGAVAALAEALPPGCNYYYSPNATASAVIAHHARGGLPAVSFPPPAADRSVIHVGSWSRPLMDEESERIFAHRFDTNGAQLAVWGVKLGIGSPVHHTAPQWVPKNARPPAEKSKFTAGYWLISVEDGWRPDMRLPDLLRPWRRARQEQIWVPTPFLELLIDDLAAPVTIAEAWLWPQSSARLEAAGHSFRDARAALAGQADGCGSCAPCIALRVVKDCYTSAIGNFARRLPVVDEGDDKAGEPAAIRAADGTVTGPPGWDPYANDAIISKALANDYRRQKRTGEKTGRWPLAIFNDAAYYASDAPDGRTDLPAGLTLGGGLGQYSHEASVPLVAVSGALGTDTFHRTVERHLRGR